MHALGSGIADAAILCRYENVLRPEALRWPDWTQGQMKKIAGGLDWLESNLAVIGDAGASDVDLGQVAVACALGYLDFRFADMNWRVARPRLDGWFVEFSKRASMQRTMPVGMTTGRWRSNQSPPSRSKHDAQIASGDPEARFPRRDPVRRAARVGAAADAGRWWRAERRRLAHGDPPPRRTGAGSRCAS